MKRATVNDACMLVSLYTLPNKIGKTRKLLQIRRGLRNSVQLLSLPQILLRQLVASNGGEFHPVISHTHCSRIAPLTIPLFFPGAATTMHLHDLCLECLS